MQGMPALEGGQAVLRRHGDVVERLPGGLYAALGRSDDTMNLGGIKVRVSCLAAPRFPPTTRCIDAAIRPHWQW